jgi:hypothetical protein
MEEGMVHANMLARDKKKKIKYSMQLVTCKAQKETEKSIVISNFLSHMFYFLE